MKQPAYHLRLNKAVDRLLMAKLLHTLNYSTREFNYYSFGGPFLEDLRVIDQFFPKARIVSLESNQQTYRRQEFHRFSRKLDLKDKNLAYFLTHEYEPCDNDVFWLDHTSLSATILREFSDVIKKCLTGTIVRITVRAEPQVDPSEKGWNISELMLNELREIMQKKFADKVGEFMPNPQISIFDQGDRFAQGVKDMVKLAVSRSCEYLEDERGFYPLQISRYRDDTQMLSITGIVATPSQLEDCKSKLGDSGWDVNNWDLIKEIDLPILTPKERYCLEALLPGEDPNSIGMNLYERLGYHVDNGQPRTIAKLKGYAELCNEYPVFMKVIG